jgi:mannose-6-phosphate isomerase-like protein (cupin superfamily)
MSDESTPGNVRANMHDLQHAYCYFLENDKFHDTDREGFRRRVVTGEHLQMCFWRITGGATGSYLHHHVDNEQLGRVMRGRLDFRIGDDPGDGERVVLEAGEAYLAPRAVWHGDSVFLGDDEYGECWILDVFAPPRADLAVEG